LSRHFHAAAVFALFLLWGVPWLQAAPRAASLPDGAAVGMNAMLFAQEGGAPAHEDLFNWINFAILVLGLGYLLRKPLGSFFADRLISIRKGLDEGRRALEASEARLAAVEEKLRNFERELADFRAASEREMEAERERLKQAAEREAERILDFARSQIEAAARAARLDLKRYAAGQALEVAEALIRDRLDDSARHRLVNRFLGGLAEKSSTRN
jgi:F-type H+-transporting ATPase subunit b